MFEIQIPTGHVDMERYEVESCARDHLVYKNTQLLTVGEEVPCKVAISCLCPLFTNGMIIYTITGATSNSADLPEGGLEYTLRTGHHC